MNKTNRCATLFLATFALAGQLARGQTTAVANWTGGNASPHGLWGNPAQWDIGTVPINNANTNFVVIITNNSGVDFDRGTSNFIQAFSLGSGAELNFGPGQALTVTGDAQLGGVISATGTNSAFWSLATNAIFIGYPRMLASHGGTVGTRISSYFYSGNENQTILQADGPSSLIDLTYARTMRITSCCGWDNGFTRRITAKNEGLVDLSGLVRIENQTGGGPDTRYDAPNALELNVENGGHLDLHSLEQISGWSTRFNVRVTNFTLPALERASYTVFNVDSNCTVVVTNLVSLAGSMVNLATNASFLASNLVDFQDCQITLAPGRNFQTLPLLNFDNTRLYVQGGVNYANVAATSFRDSHNWDVKLFEADGQDSVLDLSILQTMRITSCCGWDNGFTRRITAKNEGLVDLSGLVRIENQTGGGPDTRYDAPNALELNQETKGRLDLSSLEEISGWSTRINARSGTLALPNLASANCAWFNISDGQAVDCPELLSLNGSGLSIGFAATFNAPQLTSFTDSSLSLAPGQTFTSSTLTNIDYSRIYLQGAMGFHKVAATSYFDSHNWDVKLFEADGRGSVLDLSSLQTMRITSCCGWDNGFTRRITAKNEGLVDLSGLVRIDNQTGGGPDIQNDPPNALELNINSKGDLDLTSLQEIAGYSTRFNVGVTNYFLPNLGSVNQTTFNIDFGAGVIAPKLTNFASSAVVISPGKGFAHGLIVNFSGSKIHVLGGETFAVAAPTYSNGRGDTAEMLKADGEANGARSYLDLQSVWNVTCYGGVIVASSRGIVDLSNAIQINGTRSDYWNGWFELKASGAGELRLGDAVVSGNAKITLQGDTDRLVAGGLDLRFPARLSVGTGGEMLLHKNFTFDNTTASDVSLDSAVVRFIGTGGQMLEVGGIDNGTGVSSGNFGLGMMVVRSSDQPSTVKLVDLKNNGNRVGTAGTAEALYLFGANGGNGLRLLSGSKLVLNGLHVYARVGGVMTRLNDLIPSGQNSVAFDQGVIVNNAGGGPAILSMTPNSVVTPTADHVDVTFDIATQPGSFTTADAKITGPNGPIVASSVTPIGGTAYRINFPSQSSDGAYTVSVGPNISDLSGLVTQMDQNQNGLQGEAGDVFVGTFSIDTRPARIVSAWGLQGGNRIGARFSENLNPVSATNPANYLVNGVAATNAVFGPDNQSIVLAIAGTTVGETFTLNVNNVGDVMSNAAPCSATGMISPLMPKDIGTVGSNPRDAGSTVTFDGVGFDTTASGQMGGGSDGLQFVYETRTGDFDIRAQVARLDNASYYSEAGLMARESLAPGARLTALLVFPTNGYNAMFFYDRGSAGAGWTTLPGLSNNTPSSIPNGWLRLKREGQHFIAFRGTNGVDWAQIRDYTNSLPNSVLVGMCSSSYGNVSGQPTKVWYRNYGDFAPSILSHPQSQTVAEGANVSLGVVARGQAPLSYQWFFNNSPLAIETNDVLRLSSIKPSQAGNYFVTVSNSIGAATSQVATVTVFGGGSGGFEGDVSPRPTGNNVVTVTDWAQIGRFVAGLDTPVNGNEFARADCAPRSTLGNGRLTVADWTQAARYAAGLDPLTPSGGPASSQLRSSLIMQNNNIDTGVPRLLKLGLAQASQGQTLSMPVELTASGNENALGFSVTFDVTRLRFVEVIADAAIKGEMVQVNTNQASAGRLGVVVALSAGQSYSAGKVAVAILRFVTTDAVGEAALAFADGPVTRELASTSAQVLPVLYQNGGVTVVARPRLLAPEIRQGKSGILRLLGDDSMEYVIEVSNDTVVWTALSTNRPIAGSMEIQDSGAVGQPLRFYRAKVRE